MRRTVLAVLLALGCAPAGMANPLELLETGYTQVELAAEWATVNDYYQAEGPFLDQQGDVYEIAGTGGIGAPGTRILRLSPEGISTFAEVDGAGDPRLVALAFDRKHQMIVVVHRTVRLGDGSTGVRRSYHRIHGFPQVRRGSSPPQRMARLQAVLPEPAASALNGLGSAAPFVVSVLLLSVALTVMVRQVGRDVRRWRKG